MEYQAGVHSYQELCRIYGIAQTSLNNWLRLFETFGMEGLRTGSSATHYTKEIKEAAVQDYLSHKLPVKEILKKYQMRSLTQLSKWVMNRAGYYKWLKRRTPLYEEVNRKIAEKIEEIHNGSPDMGYRRINDDLGRYHGIKVNDKRVLRICRLKGIKSTIKYSSHGCTRQAANPQFIAENILNREFTADAPNQKWLTDVTEFKYYVGTEVHKIYLSAILDLYDRRIVSGIIGDSNNNALVFSTFDTAVEANPDATPLFHSDRGYQYTNRKFHAKPEEAGMTQSMSRVGKCIDNGPMEGFWGILKRERYYGRRFTDKESLMAMIEDYIEYYNNKRLQRKLGVLPPDSNLMAEILLFF